MTIRGSAFRMDGRPAGHDGPGLVVADATAVTVRAERGARGDAVQRIADPLLLVDTVDGAVIDSNAAAQTLFASIASAPARLDDLVGPETRACLESTLADKPLSLETTLRLGNRELPVTTTATTLQLDKRCLLVVAVIDNSAHKAFERRIEEEKEKSESASRAKSAFLAAMSHEIRTRSMASSDSLTSSRRAHSARNSANIST